MVDVHFEKLKGAGVAICTRNKVHESKRIAFRAPLYKYTSKTTTPCSFLRSMLYFAKVCFDERRVISVKDMIVVSTFPQKPTIYSF